MSELKELVEKFIELDDDLNEKIENALNEDEELPESFEEENKDQIEELGELYHEIEHMVYHEEFIIVSNANSEDKEVVALIVSDEDDEIEEYVIPVYTDEDEANEAIVQFKETEPVRKNRSPSINMCTKFKFSRDRVVEDPHTFEWHHHICIDRFVITGRSF